MYDALIAILFGLGALIATYFVGSRSGKDKQASKDAVEQIEIIEDEHILEEQELEEEITEITSQAKAERENPAPTTADVERLRAQIRALP